VGSKRRSRRGFQQFLKRNLAAITITGLLMILLLLAIAVITAIAVEPTPPGWSACDGGIAVTIGIRFGNGVVVTREDSVHHDRINAITITGLLMILLLLAIAVITAIAVEPFRKVLVVKGPFFVQPAAGKRIVGAAEGFGFIG
jgi:hypothetical protein